MTPPENAAGRGYDLSGMTEMEQFFMEARRGERCQQFIRQKPSGSVVTLPQQCRRKTRHPSGFCAAHVPEGWRPDGR